MLRSAGRSPTARYRLDEEGRERGRPEYRGSHPSNSVTAVPSVRGSLVVPLPHPSRVTKNIRATVWYCYTRKTQKILVPFNETDLSEAALEYACETFPDADITALCVIEPGGQEDLYVPQISDERQKQANDCLEIATDLAGDIPLSTEMRAGKPDQEIIEYAEEENVE